VSGFDSSLLGLIHPQTRSALVEIACHIPGDYERFRAVSYLIYAGPYLKPDELLRLKNVRENLNPNQLVATIVSQERSHYAFNFAVKIRALVTAVLAQPVADLLHNLFNVIKTIPEGDPQTYAWEGFAQAIPFLPEAERNQFFDLIMAIGNAESRRNEVSTHTIDLFKAVLGKTSYLHTGQLKALIDFIIACQDRVARIDLLCSLAETAHRHKEPYSMLIDALADSAKRQETDTLNIRILNVL